MKNKSEPPIYEKYVSYMDNDTIGIKAVIYGISSVGLLYAMYAIRPFTKFRKPSDIPNSFVHNYISFKGTVVYVHPGVNGALLMINHKPIVPIPRWNKDQYLPVKLPGINITSNGISWLQTILVGKNVTLTPVSKEKDFVECIAILSQTKEEKAPLNIAQELLKIGFGTVPNKIPEAINNSYHRPYFKSLVKAQKVAQQNRKGYWFLNTSPTKISKVKMYLQKIISIIPLLKST